MLRSLGGTRSPPLALSSGRSCVRRGPPASPGPLHCSSPAPPPIGVDAAAGGLLPPSEDPHLLALPLPTPGTPGPWPRQRDRWSLPESGSRAVVLPRSLSVLLSSTVLPSRTPLGPREGILATPRGRLGHPFNCKTQPDPLPTPPLVTSWRLPLWPAVGSCHHLPAQGQMPRGC